MPHKPVQLVTCIVMMMCIQVTYIYMHQKLKLYQEKLSLAYTGQRDKKLTCIIYLLGNMCSHKVEYEYTLKSLKHQKTAAQTTINVHFMRTWPR